MPPPDHYEYKITLEDLQAEIHFIPDYPGEQTPEWIETFVISIASRDKIYSEMAAHDIFSRHWLEEEFPNVGGSMQWLNVCIDDQNWKVPAALSTEDNQLLKPLYQNIRKLVPIKIMDSLLNRKQKYEDTYYDFTDEK